MRGMADPGGTDPVFGWLDDSVRADALLREAIAILDTAEFDRAAAYADMARQALAETTKRGSGAASQVLSESK